MKLVLLALLVLVAALVYAALRFRARIERAAAARAARKGAEAEAKKAGRLRGEVDYVLGKLRAELDAAARAGDHPDGRRVARIEELAGVLERTLEVRPGPFPISGPCAEVIDSFRAEAGDRDLLYSESGDGRWLQVEGDRVLLRWTIRELFANTVAHAGDWSRVAVLAEPVDGAILLTVRDDGIGLDRAATARLYSPFTPRAGSPGPGVGLFAVRRIVETFGGTVEAKSAVGEGVAHRLRIPHPRSGPYGDSTPAGARAATAVPRPGADRQSQ